MEIKPEDIREGDLIRWEASDSGEGHIDAIEYVALHDEDARLSLGKHYRLGRPAPKVDLPTEPTLGWVTSKYGGSVLGTWERYTSIYGSHEDSALVRELDLPLDDVSDFQEAVAVPKAALDEYRATISSWGHKVQPTSALGRFLAAVDSANEGADR
ncbi:MAG: hypothetical protein PGN07_04640 [Aeromicrobium erythreum]